jgi:hypothetical protein
MPKVLTQNMYDPVAFEAVLVREDTVVCMHPDVDPDDEETPGPDSVRVVPLEHVIHVDADPDLMVPDSEIADSFYGGCEYGFLDLDAFPEARV